MKRIGITTVMMIVTALMCGLASPQSAESLLTNAPARMRERENPFVNNESARLAGRKLFLRYCADCHGQGAEGSEQAPSLLPAVRANPAGTLQWFVKNGNLSAGMPSWSRLPDKRLWQIVTYLKSLSKD